MGKRCAARAEGARLLAIAILTPGASSLPLMLHRAKLKRLMICLASSLTSGATGKSRSSPWCRTLTPGPWFPSTVQSRIVTLTRARRFDSCAGSTGTAAGRGAKGLQHGGRMGCD
jgi:hypothetical protein